jgi:hypothetical protein
MLSDVPFTTGVVLVSLGLGVLVAALTSLHDSLSAAERRRALAQELAEQAGYVLVRTEIPHHEQPLRQLLDPTQPNVSIQLKQIFNGFLHEESRRSSWRGFAQNVVFFALGLVVPLLVAHYLL